MVCKVNISLVIILLFSGGATSNDATRQFSDLRTLVKIIDKLQKTNNSAVLTRKESLESYLHKYSDTIKGDDSRSGSEDNFIKFLPLTTYCGPGNWISILNGDLPAQKTVEAMDSCCEAHDKCGKTIRKEHDLQNYPGLSWTDSYFTRLHCSCDVEFLNCIDGLNSAFLAAAAKWIYTIAQPRCFKEEFPILNCTQQSEIFLFGKRCIEYEVDTKSARKWQWFDIPFPSSNILNFPMILLRKLYEDLFLDSSEYDFSIVV